MSGFKILAGLIFAACLAQSSFAIDATLKRADKLNRDGNYKDAYELYAKIAVSAAYPDSQSATALEKAVLELRRINRVKDSDALIEKAVKHHSNGWRTLLAAAKLRMSIEHFGYLIGGEFQRGSLRGGGKMVNAYQRDRVLALRLFKRAATVAESSGASPGERYSIITRFANAVMYDRGYAESWRLQILTDLKKLPELEKNTGMYYFGGRRSSGAPVRENGMPVFYNLPKSFESAKNDGERWRFLISEAARVQPKKKYDEIAKFASFLQTQFGVQTMAFSYYRRRGNSGAAKLAESGPYAIHTLHDNETIAKLATGLKRFTLPKEFNFIRIYREIAKSGNRNSAERALSILANIFTNRRQYAKAAAIWRENIKRFGPGYKNNKLKKLKQIIDNWGRFEPARPEVAGDGGTLLFRFRNADKVTFTAREIKVEKLLADVRKYIESNPLKLDWRKSRISNIGYDLVNGKRGKYLGAEVQNWEKTLTPAENHFDKTVIVKVPLKKAGAYLITAKVAGGNTTNIVLWLNNAIIVKKQLNGSILYFVANAETGTPIAKANLNFFGYRTKYVGRKLSNGFLRRYNVETKRAEVTTGEDGISILDGTTISNGYRWLVTARSADNSKMAYLGFQGIWFGRRGSLNSYNRTKAFMITDRPVYRPKQTVKFKFWVRRAKYDMSDDESYFARRAFSVEVRNPRGEKIYAKSLTADEFGGISDEIPLPSDATLGNYRIFVKHYGGGSFRVEEYRKPEFEVTVDAPKKPVALGDAVTAVIRAKYYFGAPVTNAKVSYKVMRTPRNSQWFPPAPWDWLYGSGYWWFGCRRAWYPGWDSWGCIPPSPWWFPRPMPQPELVMRNEVPIGRNGTVKVTIDTAVAKDLFGDVNQNYSITAEVVDQSRRLVSGGGTIVATVKPFKVTVWLDRGYLAAGDTVSASFAARTILGTPVLGKCDLKLLRISYDKQGKPSESVVATWNPEISVEGVGTQKFKVAAPGQYRLSCSVTDSKGEVIEGGYIFTVRGPGSEWTAAEKDFRFNDLEIVNDKREYAPGDKANLMLATNRSDAFVLLFPRPVNGVCPPPKPIRMNGKTAFAKIAITKGDMPNIFVEALTISNGRVHSAMRELVVPPEKRVLNVKLIPNHAKPTEIARYKPGEKANLKIKVTDIFGKPVTSSVALTVYDKSVEYISGGSNVADIKSFFWKWRRKNTPSATSSVDRYFNNIVKRGDDSMLNLGLFGAITADSGATARSESKAFDSISTLKSPRGVGRSRHSMIISKSASLDKEKEGNSQLLPSAVPQGVADGKGRQSGQADSAKIAIRSNFADTAYWNASIKPNADGIAEIAIPMPENLTTWVVRAWSVAGGTKVGAGKTEIITSKEFILRLISPRFLVEGDEATFSAIIHNRSDVAKTAKVAIKLDGTRLRLQSNSSSSAVASSNALTVSVPADGEARVEWRVEALRSGEPKVVMTAVSGKDSDGMEIKLPILVHGIEKQVAFTGSIPAEASAKPSALSESETLAKGAMWCDPKTKTAKLAFDVPADRRVADTLFTLRYSPTLAGAMVDALPYLVSYPYGCTEQTLNRFLPTVITRDILRGMKLNLDDIRKKRANLNAAELGDPAKRAAQWKNYAHGDKNPVFNEKIVDEMISKGVGRLRSMQNSDGGWGWFSGYDEHSYPHTTALVVRGLIIAKRLGVRIPGGIVGNGIAWLKSYQNREIRELENAQSKTDPYKISADNLDALVLSVLVDAGENGDAVDKMTKFLYRDRTKISVYAKCLLALAAHKRIPHAANSAGLTAIRDMLLRNIEQFLVKNPSTQTAYLNLGSSNRWWYWYGSENESMAAYLKLLSAVKPKSENAAWLVKYLLDNRKHGSRWSSTRDTALCVEALADYIRASGEGEPNLTVEIRIDGKLAKTVKIDKNNLFSYDDRLILKPAELATGKHLCEIRVKGSGPLYISAYLKYFSLEKFITKTGLRIKTRRRFYKLEKVKASAKVAGKRGQVVDQKIERFKRIPLANLAEVKSGDLIEVELLVDSDNDYEYIMLRDDKPAGLEPMENRSGYNGNDMGAYVEFRDSKVCFFVRSLARGSHSLSYRLRAETPGKFSALPAIGSAMYALELKSNSDEFKIKIAE